ncbi:hypothetical protein EPUS_05789 [Endocarpon pusillum Z07020]|uniref:Isotrichodermin C-15 hydroxylase n=1 Tax=Endocarpon pusillum (strain Z07020 / HMAS-L-300199) TaxID=1263415 RepID=U1I1S3_ENDPU|nr:uncharacterized protein EPUS_05789 [Endocarpon pusillum Z07020]ERF77220.1 hypothetical protein EPUS_05789 [Endocarpon pusillum Z07020]
MDSAADLRGRGSWSYSAAEYPVVAVTACSVLLILWAIAHILYNIFLHPLRNHPGPKLWAATRVPWCWYQYQGILHERLLELHVKYGHTVRIAPYELSFTSDTAWKTIYGHRSVEMDKDPVFRLHTPTGAQNILVADRQTHIRQRRLLSHAFSEKALREQEGILQTYVSKLLEQLSLRYTAGPLNMVAWYNFTTFDLIGDLSSGEKFGCLDKGDYVPFVRATERIAKELTFTQMLIYFGVAGVRQFFLPKAVAGQRAQNMKRAIDTVERRIQRDTDRKDFLYYILAANDEKGMSRAEIHVNSFSFNIAGSESSATALSGITYHILTRSSAYSELIHEIRTSFTSEEEITIASTNDLKYLEAVISESLRLYPPVAGTLPRVVPAPGETIDGIHVPTGTTVGVHHFSCFRHPANFHRPDEFLPERWLPECKDVPPFDKDNRAAVQPFSFGPRNCLGKNLARAEMRLIMAKLLWRFDLELVPGGGGSGKGMGMGNGKSWRDGQKVWGFWVKPPLMCWLRPVSRD